MSYSYHKYSWAPPKLHPKNIGSDKAVRTRRRLSSSWHLRSDFVNLVRTNNISWYALPTCEFQNEVGLGLIEIYKSEGFWSFFLHKRFFLETSGFFLQGVVTVCYGYDTLGRCYRARKKICTSLLVRIMKKLRIETNFLRFWKIIKRIVTRCSADFDIVVVRKSGELLLE